MINRLKKNPWCGFTVQTRCNLGIGAPLLIQKLSDDSAFQHVQMFLLTSIQNKNNCRKPEMGKQYYLYISFTFLFDFLKFKFVTPYQFVDPSGRMESSAPSG